MERLGRISRRSGVTRYHQLYTYLRRALLDGAIRPGSALPSEPELMREYQLSRNTVRRAVGALEEQRLVVRRRGSGTFARHIEDSGLTAEGVAEVVRDPKRLQAETAVRVVHFGIVDTPEHVFARSPQFSRRSLLIYRTRSYSGDCFAVHTSFVHEKASAGLTRARLGNRTVSTALASLGHAPREGTQAITAAAADVVAARHLDIPAGSPVLRIEGMTRSEDLPVEYYVCLFRSDCYQIAISLTFEGRSTGCPPVVTVEPPPLP